MAFDSVLTYIHEIVINQNEVVQLKTLCNIYINKLEKNGSPYPNFKGIYLKEKIEKNNICKFIKFLLRVSQ